MDPINHRILKCGREVKQDIRVMKCRTGSTDDSFEDGGRSSGAKERQQPLEELGHCTSHPGAEKGQETLNEILGHWLMLVRSLEFLVTELCNGKVVLL